jgi:hypothetical protein
MDVVKVDVAFGKQTTCRWMWMEDAETGGSA